ncbi:vegetative cell wall protein gp1-like [Quillaja saponaria]|uniref:Vegetative cell wall protein gp1-like n=1 Tax=Quillaja saponaria TaxID=32244 RepID=A0AAD7LSD2_QUISA|nr:vegetative cell wall protein gp1-like [Quillaja saponaria]
MPIISAHAPLPISTIQRSPSPPPIVVPTTSATFLSTPQVKVSTPGPTSTAGLPTRAQTSSPPLFPALDPAAQTTPFSGTTTIRSFPSSQMPIISEPAPLPTLTVKKPPSPPLTMVPTPPITSVTPTPQVKVLTPAPKAAPFVTPPAPAQPSPPLLAPALAPLSTLTIEKPPSPPPRVVPTPLTTSDSSAPQVKVSSPPSSFLISQSVPSTFPKTTFPPKAAQLTRTSPSSNAAPITRVPSPTQSPKTIKSSVQTPPQSSQLKAVSPPPLSLPKPLIETEPIIPVEAEQKTVMFQKIFEKPQQWFTGNAHLHKESGDNKNPRTVQNTKQDLTKEIEKKEKSTRRLKLSNSEDVSMRIITLAGENKGAFMEQIQTPNKHEFGANPKPIGKTIGGQLDSSSSGIENEKGKNNYKSHKGKTVTSPQMKAFMNCNTQGVNNSIMFSGSSTHHDPGVHFSLSRKPFSEVFEIKEHVNGHHI